MGWRWGIERVKQGLSFFSLLPFGRRAGDEGLRAESPNVSRQSAMHPGFWTFSPTRKVAILAFHTWDAVAEREEAIVYLV